jgi:uncharacterized protein YuzE
MKIIYHESDDILHIELQAGAIVRDVSLNWNVNVGYSDAGVAEITILDAKQTGLFPLVLEGDTDKLLEKKAA